MSLSAINCQLHCLLPLLVKLSCSTPSYQNNFIRSCICVSFIELENFMTVFIAQLVLYELFPEFQWTSLMEIAKQITGTYKFLSSWARNFWNNRYIWNSSYGFLMYLKKIFFKQSRHDAKDGDTPANKWDLAKSYFLEKFSVKKCIKCSRKFYYIIWKT